MNWFKDWLALRYEERSPLGGGVGLGDCFRAASRRFGLLRATGGFGLVTRFGVVRAEGRNQRKGSEHGTENEFFHSAFIYMAFGMDIPLLQRIRRFCQPNIQKRVRLKLSIRSAEASSACWERRQIRADEASALLTPTRSMPRRFVGSRIT